LGYLDKKGFDFEMATLDGLEPLVKQYGFRITYHNPKEPHKWKRTRGYGTDMTLEIDNLDGYTYRLHTEESFQSHQYHYRKTWFFNSRLKRFEGKPRSRFDIRVLLVNMPENFKGVSSTAKKFHVHIFNLNGLLAYINHLAHSSFRRPKFRCSTTDVLPSPSATVVTKIVPDTVTLPSVVTNQSTTIPTRTNNVYAYDNKIDIDNNVVSSNPVIALLQEARRIKLWEDSLLENGINPE
jgi:hypothetical protein